MMVSNTKGAFTVFEGKVDYDLTEKSLKSMEGFIEAASINTHNEKRDTHLKNEDFFNAIAHPRITFKSSAVRKTGDNTFEVDGILNVLGVDHKVTLPVTVNGPVDDPWGNKRIGLECQTVLTRRDLGITESPAAMIGDEVKVSIEAEAVYK
jgi:polyisoprenoid-binding protein YceI